MKDCMSLDGDTMQQIELNTTTMPVLSTQILLLASTLYTLHLLVPIPDLLPFGLLEHPNHDPAK